MIRDVMTWHVMDVACDKAWCEPCAILCRSVGWGERLRGRQAVGQGNRLTDTLLFSSVVSKRPHMTDQDLGLVTG